jgi:hypothetical protein
MEKKVILIITTILSILYCFRFGYILTGYGHGGQLVGIPFAILMIVFSILCLFVTDKNLENKIFIITIFYFSTIAFFSLTIEAIIRNSNNAFEILYKYNTGVIGKIFIGFIVLGTFTSFLAIKKFNKNLH